MKRVLLIGYHFPPDAAVGAVRLAKFAEYLPEFGWEPIILTVKEKYYSELDESLSNRSRKKPIVIRTAMLRNPSYYYRKLKNTLLACQGKADASRSSSPRDKRNSGMGIRRAINAILSFPDEEAGWFPFTLMRGVRIIRQKGIEVLMTSGPPHSVNLIGGCLSKLVRIPWVADFRDPWSDNCVEQPGIHSEVFQTLLRRLEAWCISEAALILTTTERFAQQLKLRFGEHQHKIATIPNGYEPQEFRRIARGKETQFTITYAGSLYHHRSPEAVLRVISELVREKHMDRDRLAIRFIGACEQTKGKSMNSLINEYALGGVVEVLPWQPRHRVVEMLVRSDVLLLLAENQPLQIPAKVYDYLGSGRDIVAITGDGATADLLRETGRGVVVSPEDPLALKSTMLALYRRYENGKQDGKAGGAVENAALERYKRSQLTGDLSRVLERVTCTCSDAR